MFGFKAQYWTFWLLLASSAAFAQDTVAIPINSIPIDPSSVTFPGAMLALGYMISRWKPTLRVELTDSRGDE